MNRTEVHSGFSSRDSIAVSGLLVRASGSPQGVNVEHVGSGNYRVYEGSSGGFELATALGTLTLSSGTTDSGTRGNIIFRTGVSTLASRMTLTPTGRFQFNSATSVDLTGGSALMPRTVVSSNSVTLADGEFSIASVSVTSALLVFRSGNTTYTFIAAAAAVL